MNYAFISVSLLKNFIKNSLLLCLSACPIYAYCLGKRSNFSQLMNPQVAEKARWCVLFWSTCISMMPESASRRNSTGCVLCYNGPKLILSSTKVNTHGHVRDRYHSEVHGFQLVDSPSISWREVLRGGLMRGHLKILILQIHWKYEVSPHPLWWNPTSRSTNRKNLGLSLCHWKK